MSDMAANRLSGVICLVLLSVVVHCYPYGEAYKTVVKHPTNRGHFLSRYPYPDKEDGDSDDKPVALESVQEGSLLRSFYPRAFEESSNNGLGPSPEGADGQMPILSPANQKTVNSPYTWPTAIKRFPAQSVNVRIRRPFQSHFRAGDIANVRTVYEHGNSQTESEEQRFPATRPEGGADGDFPVPVKVGPPRRRASVEPSLAGLEERYGELFLTRRFPGGTMTHFRTGYEHGNDEWKETHYVRYNPPSPAQYKPWFQGVRKSTSLTGQV